MKYAEDLKAFVDGELSLAQMMAIRTAMESDPELRQEAEFMKLLGDAVREEAKEPEVKPEGARTLIEKLPARKRRPTTFSLRPLAWTGAAILLAALVYGGFHMGSSDDRVQGDTRTVATAAPSSSVFGEAKASTVTPQNQNMAMKRASGAAVGKAATGGFSMSGAVAMGRSHMGLGENKTTSPRFAPSSPQAPPAPNAKNILTAPANRKVIQNADLEIAADNVIAAQTSATTIAKSVGGYVESTNLDFSDQPTASATLTLRVPAIAFDDVMARLEKDLGTVKSIDITGQDVTAQYADTDARLGELKAEEDSYITMLRGARSIGQILEIKDRLSSVRQDIQSYQEQLSALKDQSMLSTIDLTLDQKAKTPPKPATKAVSKNDWASNTWDTAVGGLSAVAKFLAQCVIFLFVFSPIWIPVLAAVWYFNKKRG